MGKKRFEKFDYRLYEKIDPHFIEFRKEIARNILADAGINPCKRFDVLEIGTGDGATTLELLASSPNIQVVSVDNEKNMVNAANQRLTDYQDRVKLIYSDALSFLRLYKGIKFDGFASGLTLHNFTNDYRIEVLERIYCILKPEAPFVVGDKFAYRDTNKHAKCFIEMIKNMVQLPPTQAMEWVCHMAEDQSPERIWYEDKALDDLAKSEFRDLRFVWEKKGYNARVLTATRG